MARTRRTPTYKRKSTLAIYDGNMIVGEVLHEGKNFQLSKYNSGGRFIEDKNGKDVVIFGNQVPDDVAVEVAKLFDKKMPAKTDESVTV